MLKVKCNPLKVQWSALQENQSLGEVQLAGGRGEFGIMEAHINGLIINNKVYELIWTDIYLNLSNQNILLSVSIIQ